MSRVAIVIPCFNAGAPLLEAVESAESQSHPHCEIVIVDDGSTDSTTLRLLAALRGRGLRVLGQANGGPSSARNLGIRASSAEYILPLDADDRLCYRTVEIAARELDGNPSVGIVAGGVRHIGYRSGEYACEYSGISSMLLSTTIPNISMYRRDDWARCGGYPENLRLGEDWAFWMRMLALGVGVSVKSEVFYEYRSSARQATRHIDPVRVAEAMNFVLLENREIYLEYPDVVFTQLAHDRLLLAHFRRNYGTFERGKSHIKQLVSRLSPRGLRPSTGAI